MAMPVGQIVEGDCLEVMRGWLDNVIDTILTDPPYGLGFMGKEWDTFKDARATRKEEYFISYSASGKPGRHHKGFSAACSAGQYDHSRNAEFQQWFTGWATETLRIAKPGCMMLVFGGTRTYHRLTCAIEDAGWQIRDCMMWLYGSGFPKSHNISKAIDKAKGARRKVIREGQAYGMNKTNMEQGYRPSNYISKQLSDEPVTSEAKLWDGYGTALKPAWEPILVAMKPLDGTFAHNAEKWGVAGLNINGGRIETKEYLGGGAYAKNSTKDMTNRHTVTLPVTGKDFVQPQGRWPANLILDEESSHLLDEQSGASKSTASGYNFELGNQDNPSRNVTNIKSGVHHGDSGGASRFFYCAKASRAERNAGLEGMEAKKADLRSDVAAGLWTKMNAKHQNNHPTVKPLALMEYLCKLTMTPTGGIVLDPFAGSGTTCIAAYKTGRKYIGIEKDADYVQLSRRRLAQHKEMYSLLERE